MCMRYGDNYKSIIKIFGVERTQMKADVEDKIQNLSAHNDARHCVYII